MQLPTTPQPWQRLPAMQFIAVLAACGPIYGLAIWSGFATIAQRVTRIPSLQESILEALVTMVLFGGLVWLAMLLLNGELPRALQLQPAPLARDIGHGIVLWLGLLGLQVAYISVYTLLSQEPVTPPAFNTELGKALAADPWLMGIWLTLVAWLQAGLIEEYTRAFLLSRLWRVYPTPTGRWLVLIGSSLIFGLGHAYQGPAAIYGTALIGFFLGHYYMRNGRVLPLIIGHALYNSVVMAILAYGSTLLETSG